MNKKELIARAQELKIEVPEGATNPEIESLIKVGEHPLLLKGINALKEERDTFKTALEAAENEVKDLKVQVEKLAKNLEVNEEKDASHAVYKTGKDKYVFGVKAFRFKGEKYTAEEAVKDADLMDALIKGKFIHLKKQ